jgi:hypothetical protein
MAQAYKKIANPTFRWTPKQLPGVLAFYDFMTQKSWSGSNLIDYSGNGRNLIQSIAGNKATFGTDSYNMPGLYHDGNDYASCSIPANTTFSILLCLSPTISNTNPYAAIAYVSSAQSNAMTARFTTAWNAYGFGTGNRTIGATNGPVSLLTPACIACTTNGVDNLTVFANSGIGSTNLSQPGFLYDTIVLGEYTGGTEIVGYYYFFAISSSVLTQTDFNNWRTYCQLRTGYDYGITLNP